MIEIGVLKHLCDPTKGHSPVPILGEVMETGELIGWGPFIPVQGVTVSAFHFRYCPYCKEPLPRTLDEYRGGKVVDGDGEDRGIGFRTPGGKRSVPGPAPEEQSTTQPPCSIVRLNKP